MYGYNASTQNTGDDHQVIKPMTFASGCDTLIATPQPLFYHVVGAYHSLQ